MRTSRRILKNIFSLSFAEAANKGIIFITTAYLARVLLPEGFGIIGWVNSILIFFVMIVNFGISTIGTREIAQKPDKIPSYANNIITIRIILFIISYLALAVMVFLLQKPMLVKYVLLVAGVQLFAYAILVDWVFQGIERMEVLAIRQVITGVLNLVGVIVLVHNEGDVIIAMAITSGALCINSIWMLILYIKMYGPIKIKFEIPLWRELLKSSILIAFFILFTTIFNQVNITLLGAMRTAEETGIYYAAFKIMQLAILPSAILQFSFFPLLSRSETLEDRRKAASKYALLLFLVGSFISMALFTYSDFTGVFVYGAKYAETSSVLKIMMIYSVIVYLNTSYTIPLIAWKREKSITLIYGLGSIMSFLSNFLLIPIYGIYGAAFCSLISELFAATCLTIVFFKTLNQLYLVGLLKALILAGISCGIGYSFMILGIYPIIAGIISLVIFILINFAFKTVSLSEIKGYFAK